MQHRAILDPDGVYQGHEPALEDFEFRAGDPPPLSPDCDLAPGRYRWDGQKFLPIGEPTGERILEQPPILRAMALGFAAIDEKDPDLLPPETKEFLRWFKTTLDAVRPKG